MEFDLRDVLNPVDAHFFNAQAVFTCPVCHDVYSHVREVFCRRGTDPYEGAPYPGAVERGVTHGWRRAAVVVVIDGESCGHAWEIVVQQNKGNNYLIVNRLPDLPKEG